MWGLGSIRLPIKEEGDGEQLCPYGALFFW